MSTGLRFEADLAITTSGAHIDVASDADGALVVTTDEWRPVVSGMRADGALPRGALRGASRRLAAAGATVHLRTPTSGLLTLGAAARPGAVVRAAGLRHVQVESARGLPVALRPTWGRLALGAGGLLAVGVASAARRRTTGRRRVP